MQALLGNLISLDDAVERCLAAKLILPALTLLYAGIDVVASLERVPDEGTRASFTWWVDSYLLKAKPLACTALELYAARCGILHTFTAKSDLSRSGKARQVLYAWGNASSTDLNEAISKTGDSEVVGVHVEDLREGFRLGILAWFKDVHADNDRMSKVETASGAWFTHMSTDVVKTFLGSDSSTHAV